MKPTHVRMFVQWKHARSGETEVWFRWEGERTKIPKLPTPDYEDGDTFTLHAQVFVPKLLRALNRENDDGQDQA